MYFFGVDGSSSHRGVTVEYFPFSSVIVEETRNDIYMYEKLCVTLPQRVGREFITYARLKYASMLRICKDILYAR